MLSHGLLDGSSPPITLAQVIPVSEGEYQTWRVSLDELERSFDKRKVDIADLNRKP